MAMTLGEKEGGRSRLGHDWGDNGSVSVVMMAWRANPWTICAEITCGSPSGRSSRPLRLAARLPRHHRLPDFGYINHGYSTHVFTDHGSLGSFALATSTMAQRAIIRVEHSCRFIFQSKYVSTTQNAYGYFHFPASFIVYGDSFSSIQYRLMCKIAVDERYDVMFLSS
uniref:Uncharacterized protein n=1 Tax=Oryza nivara TaxID=4536 RepID=A0A0E0I613_ORYNI